MPRVYLVHSDAETATGLALTTYNPKYDSNGLNICRVLMLTFWALEKHLPQ